MNKIWLDVTTILSWNRPAVGIVRVESECASGALQQDKEAIYFCRYDAEKGYKQVMPSDVRIALERIQGAGLTNSKTDEVMSLAEDNGLPMLAEERVKILFLRLIDILPRRLKAIVFDFAKANKHRALHIFHRFVGLYQRIRGKYYFSKDRFFSPSSKARPKKQHSRTSPFGTGDVYISLGLDWDQKDLEFLYEQKRAIKFKVLLFCYDIIPVKFPHLCVGEVSASFARYFADVAWCADKVLCISECSRRDLRELLVELNTPTPPMSVIQLGCNILTNSITSDSGNTTRIVDKKYILYVSTIERRKNHEVLYRAYTRLVDNKVQDLPILLFVGMPGWGVNDLLNDIKLDPRVDGLIVQLNHVSDTALANIYKNALFTVYPSLYEGWGLPVEESLAAGKFCLASNAASIPEVGGNLIEYIDPWDIEGWKNKIGYYINNPEILEKKEKIITSSYSPTAWQTTAGRVFSHAIELLTSE